MQDHPLQLFGSCSFSVKAQSLDKWFLFEAGFLPSFFHHIKKVSDLSLQVREWGEGVRMLEGLWCSNLGGGEERVLFREVTPSPLLQVHSVSGGRYRAAIRQMSLSEGYR